MTHASIRPLPLSQEDIEKVQDVLACRASKNGFQFQADDDVAADIALMIDFAERAAFELQQLSLK